MFLWKCFLCSCFICYVIHVGLLFTYVFCYLYSLTSITLNWTCKLACLIINRVFYMTVVFRWLIAQELNVWCGIPWTKRVSGTRCHIIKECDTIQWNTTVIKYSFKIYILTIKTNQKDPWKQRLYYRNG